MKGFLTNIPIIETNRLILRKFREKDVEDVYEYASNENVTKYLPWKKHKNLKVTTDYINLVLSNYLQGQLPAPWAIVFREIDKVIGTIEFVKIDSTNNFSEIGYVLSEDYWGRGITVEAVLAILRIGFNDLKFNRIQARCLEDNVQSSKVMNKIGMSYEGILRKHSLVKGDYKDIRMYSILRDEWKDI